MNLEIRSTFVGNFDSRLPTSATAHYQNHCSDASLQYDCTTTVQRRPDILRVHALTENQWSDVTIVINCHNYLKINAI